MEVYVGMFVEPDEESQDCWWASHHKWPLEVESLNPEWETFYLKGAEGAWTVDGLRKASFSLENK